MAAQHAAATFFIASIFDPITWTHHSSKNAPAQSTDRKCAASTTLAG